MNNRKTDLRWPLIAMGVALAAFLKAKMALLAVTFPIVLQLFYNL